MTTYTPPTEPGTQTSTVKPRSVVAVSESPFTYAQQVQTRQGQGWQIEVTLPPMTRATAAPWLGFFLKLNGREHTFLMGDPDGRTPRGVATGTPVVDGAGQTGQSLATKGWTANTTGILKSGDYIQIGQRLYALTADADSNADGEATLAIWPRLRQSPADEDPITTTNTVGLWRLDEMPTWPNDVNNLYTITFTASEAL